MHLLSLFGQSPYYDEYGPYYNDGSVGDAGVAAAMFATIFFFTLIVSLVVYAIYAYMLSRIFKKAGVEAWKAWVPVYNNWIMLELGGQQGFWAVLAFIPIVNIVAVVFMYIAMYHIGLKLGKEGVFVLLAIFLPLVWVIWLALDKSTWQGAPSAPTGPQGGAPAYQPPVEQSSDSPTPPASK